MHFSKNVFIIFLTSVSSLVIAKELPLKYSFTATHPQFEPTGNQISVYQDGDFAMLQSHPLGEEPNFKPVNHWDYNMSGTFSENKFTVLREAENMKFLVTEEPAISYKEGITFVRKQFEKTAFTVEYSDLNIHFKPLEDAESINGLPSKHTVVTAELLATIRDDSGEILHSLKGTFKHQIWLSSEIPFSSIAYNLIIHPETPILFIEPENYDISNKRPWLTISNEIYERLIQKVNPEGMIVKMNSTYTYSEQGKEYQSANSTLQLTKVRSVEKISFQPDRYPLLPEPMFQEVYDAIRFSSYQKGAIPEKGQLKLSVKQMGNVTGHTIYQATNRFFAIRGHGLSGNGDTLNLVLLKINTQPPEKGNQFLTNIPISGIRARMEQGADEKFKETFFIGGFIKSAHKTLYFLHPIKGRLKISNISDEMISGTFKIDVVSAQIKHTVASEIVSKLAGDFIAWGVE